MRGLHGTSAAGTDPGRMQRITMSPMCMILTVGHSTRSIEEFVGLLQTHDVRRLVDVRRIPRSARCPHFNDRALAVSLERAGIAYLLLPALGGLRKPVPDSLNAGWRAAGFRGFADHMQTEEFERALSALIGTAARERVAVMCAEALPWRCHRSLIADALAARGVAVEHILGAGRREAHSLRPWARVAEGRVFYPPPPTSLGIEAVDTVPGPARGAPRDSSPGGPA